MADRQIDPARLQGEALRKWYLRSPDELERERQAAAARRHRDFFGVSRDLDPGFNPGRVAPARDIDPGFSRGDESSGQEIDPGFSRSASGADRWHDEPASHGPFRQLSWDSAGSANRAFLDRGLAGPDDDGEIIEIGNPYNRRLKREHIQRYGFWPQTDDGRDYDVSHRRAIADGGTNTLDNIEPMHPDEHRAKHQRDGDPNRFSRRAAIARAFGGRVEPPAHAPRPARGPTVRGFGVLGLIPNLTGILSGRIRTDNFDNFTSDMLGYPSQQDIRERDEEFRRRYFPNSKPGDVVA